MGRDGPGEDRKNDGRDRIDLTGEYIPHVMTPDLVPATGELLKFI